jgi:tight adherence protein B
MVDQSTILLLGVLALLGMGALLAMRVMRVASPISSPPRSLRLINEEFRSRYDLRDDTADDLTGFGVDDDDLAEGTERGSGRAGRQGLALRLHYAQLDHVPPYVLAIVQIVISLVAFAVARSVFREALQAFSLLTGPMVVNWYIERRIERRVKMFDADFPQFLLSVVGMLKTGLNSTQALQAAATNLDDDSVVREEVELMLERLRVGVPEDRSVGSFAEDVRQPEIELFVQALILSRRVGGNLADTVERLSKQVRKRHAFKLAASSTVSMQRGSVWVIIAIISGLQLYLLKMQPDMVLGAWTDPKLSGVAQIALIMVIMGILWMRKITNFKI